MDKYVISEEEEVLDAEPPFPESFKTGIKIMEMHKNTKFGKIIDFVNKLFENETVRRVIFRGLGDAAEKCVSCVEVFKRKWQEELFQWNALSTAKRVTYWDPIVTGMNRLKVTVDTPVIFIMLSRDPYPAELQCLSMQRSSDNGTKAHAKPMQSRPRAVGKRQNRRPNKWSRPTKDAKEGEIAERQEILEKLEKLP